MNWILSIHVYIYLLTDDLMRYVDSHFLFLIRSQPSIRLFGVQAKRGACMSFMESRPFWGGYDRYGMGLSFLVNYLVCHQFGLKAP